MPPGKKKEEEIINMFSKVWIVLNLFIYYLLYCLKENSVIVYSFTFYISLFLIVYNIHIIEVILN